jgi:Leucine Rich repeat
MLAKAMRMNFSVVVLSLRIRNLMERQQINKYVVRNVEYIRQARQRYFKATGQQRERNQVEKLFDRVADNDATIQEVSMVGNKRFLTLTPEEKVRAAASFGGNAHVTTLNLNSCGIDDEFVRALALSLQKSSSIERLHLEGNDISGEGIMALFEALAKNSTIEELRLHKQSKLLNTSDEHILADILEPNTTITKLGIDLRTTMAQVAIDRKLTLNRNLTLKLRAEAKVSTDFAPNDSFAAL